MSESRLELWDRDGIPWRVVVWPSAPPTFEVPVIEKANFSLADPGDLPTEYVPVKRRTFVRWGKDGETWIYREQA